MSHLTPLALRALLWGGKYLPSFSWCKISIDVSWLNYLKGCHLCFTIYDLETH